MCINGYIVLPGQKLCPKCRLKVSEPEKEEEKPYKQDGLNDESFCFQEEGAWSQPVQGVLKEYP